MSISQLLVPNDLKLYVGDNQVQKRASRNVNAVQILSGTQSLIYDTLTEEVEFKHTTGQEYIVSFSGNLFIEFNDPPVQGQELILEVRINNAAVIGTSTPPSAITSSFALGYDYSVANAGGASNSYVNVSSQFLISNLGAFYPNGETISFNIRLINNASANIILGANATSITVSCVELEI